MQSCIYRFRIKRDGKEIRLTKEELDAIITLHEKENIRRTIMDWASSELSFSDELRDKETKDLLKDARFVRKLVESFDYPFFDQMHMDVNDSAATILDVFMDAFLRGKIKDIQEECNEQ